MAEGDLSSRIESFKLSEDFEDDARLVEVEPEAFPVGTFAATFDLDDGKSVSVVRSR